MISVKDKLMKAEYQTYIQVRSTKRAPGQPATFGLQRIYWKDRLLIRENRPIRWIILNTIQDEFMLHESVISDENSYV